VTLPNPIYKAKSGCQRPEMATSLRYRACWRPFVQIASAVGHDSNIVELRETEEDGEREFVTMCRPENGQLINGCLRDEVSMKSA
jgi:hypothetical protein